MRVLLPAALSILISVPAAAQYPPGHSGAGYGAQQNAIDPPPPVKKTATTKKTDNATSKKSRKTTTSYYGQPYRSSAYSANPAYDVYVNGQYVGSDPDPRIRATLAAEARSTSGMR